MRVSLPVVVVAFVAACGGGADEPRYAQDCVVDSDCTMMPGGDLCAACAEDYVAVNVDEVEAILTEAQRVEYCPIWSRWGEAECAERPTSAPICVDGQCTETTDGAPCPPAGRGMCQGVSVPEDGDA